MNDTFSVKLGMERCTACDHRWIDYEGARGVCYMCGGTNISECVSLKELRETIASLRKGDKKYLDKQAKRTIILKQLYREVAELSLNRAQEIYTKVKEHYTKGDLSDKVIDQLIMAFRLFSDLGVHTSAGAIAYLIAAGYAQRGAEKEIKDVNDLNDLVAARQWFLRLGAKDWENAINLRIGEKAMTTVSADHQTLQNMTQVSVWHLYKAREYYYDQRSPKMLDRVQFDIERATQLLTTYTQGASQIEAARIAAQSTMKYGEDLRRGLERFGTSIQHGLTALGEHIEAYGGSLSQAMQATSKTLSANMAQAMYSLSAGSKYRGHSLDQRMSDVGKLISTSAKEVPEGFFQPIKELGAKFALGSANSENKDLSSDPAIIKLAESVIPEAMRTNDRNARTEEPTIKLTGTLLDTLLTKGMNKVVEQLEAAEKKQDG